MSRRRGARGLLALAAVALPLLPVAAGPAGAAGAAATASATVGPLPFLHVVTPPAGSADATPYLADPAGRQVLLRGVAAVGLQDVAYPGADGGPALFPVSPAAYDGTCPPASARIPQPPLCEVQAARAPFSQSTAPGSGDDFAQMRLLGYNLVRLVLNWSQLEPSPGRYSATYLDRVAQVVGWARQQGIYVILDMHQDQYSRFILPGKRSSSCTQPSGGSDGAPAWAVFTLGRQGCALFGETSLNPASSAAFYSFWHNHPVAGPKGQSPGTGLQDHYIGALAALARRFSGNATVVGYELMNEPQPGSLAQIPVENLYQSSAQDLYPFYRRAIEALTGVRDGMPTCPASAPTGTGCAYPQQADVHRQLIFFEPLAYRNLTDFTPQVSAPFTGYPDIVYAPHVYTHAFTVDTFLGYPTATSPYPPNYTFGYQTAEAEAQAMHAAVLTTEFGDASSTDPTVLAGEEAAQQATLTGGTLWAWKGLSKLPGTCWCVRWQHSTFQTTSDGTPGRGNPRAAPSPADLAIPTRVTYTAAAWPVSTAGRLLAYSYRPASRSFVMVAADPATAVRHGDRSAETVVYVPPGVRGAVTVASSATLDAVVRRPDGSRLVYVAPGGAASGGATTTYRVTVGPVPAAQMAQVAALAARPLPPITEPQARQLLEATLAAAATSPSASVRSQASLAQALAGLLLGPTDPAAPAG